MIQRGTVSVPGLVHQLSGERIDVRHRRLAGQRLRLHAGSKRCDVGVPVGVAGAHVCDNGAVTRRAAQARIDAESACTDRVAVACPIAS